ncbi:cobalamin-binding protein, partial [bacterium]
MRRALLVLLPLASLVLGGLATGGCQQAQAIGGKARPTIYRRIVSLSPSTSEVLVSNGIPLSGRTAACDYPANVKSVPVVAGVKPDYEALAKVKP